LFELQDALNKIWKVQPRSESILLGVIRERVFSFALVLVLGFLLLVSLVVSTALGAAGNFMAPLLPWPVFLLESVNFLLSSGVIALLLAVIFKYLPDTEIAWADVWIGAAVTSLLLTTGKALVGLYLARSTVTSAYGVAAALIIPHLGLLLSTDFPFGCGSHARLLLQVRFAGRRMSCASIAGVALTPQSGVGAAKSGNRSNFWRGKGR